jgi:hypothetical protein
MALAAFGTFFVSCLIGLAVVWFKWPGSMSSIRKIIVAEFIVGGLISGAFLVAAKVAAPEVNRRRLIGLTIAVFAFQFVIDILQ